MDARTAFEKEVIASFNATFAQAAPRLWEIMTNQRTRNMQKEDGKQLTVETIKPSIRVELDSDDRMHIKTTIEGVEKYRDVWTVERDCAPGQPNQPELNLNAGQSGTPEEPVEVTRDGFYDRMDKYNVSEEDLDDYFGAMPCADFEHWLEEGTNREEARMILTDCEHAEMFADMVFATQQDAVSGEESDGEAAAQ